MQVWLSEQLAVAPHLGSYNFYLPGSVAAGLTDRGTLCEEDTGLVSGTVGTPERIINKTVIVLLHVSTYVLYLLIL